jgi:hypothetical protein
MAGRMRFALGLAALAAEPDAAFEQGEAWKALQRVKGAAPGNSCWIDICILSHSSYIDDLSCDFY